MAQYLPTRRGAALLVIATIQVILGWATYDTPGLLLKNLQLASQIDPHALGTAQMLLGAIVMGFAFADIQRDKWGFSLALLGPAFWSAVYFLTWALGPIGEPLPGLLNTASLLRGGVIYAGYAALLLVVSGMIGIRQLHITITNPGSNDGSN